jgi:hypothetical protein
MPITVERNDATRHLVATGSGAVTFEELAAFLDTHRVGEPQRYKLLFDLHTAHLACTAAEVRRLAERIRTSSAADDPRGPVAFVTPHDVDYGMVRMFEALYDRTETHAIRVFRSRGQARNGWMARNASPVAVV